MRQRSSPSDGRWRWRCAAGTDQPKPAEPQDPGTRKLSSVDAKSQHERRENSEREKKTTRARIAAKKKGEERAGGRKPGPPQASVALLSTLSASSSLVFLSLKWRLCDYSTVLYEYSYVGVGVTKASTNMRPRKRGLLAVSPRKQQVEPIVILQPQIITSLRSITAQSDARLLSVGPASVALHPKRANGAQLVRT